MQEFYAERVETEALGLSIGPQFTYEEQQAEERRLREAFKRGVRKFNKEAQNDSDKK